VAPENNDNTKNNGQEDQAQSTASILNMDREEFQKLQENDPTLESIRKLVRESTTLESRGNFSNKKG
jgi:hypothetical protein